MYIALFTIVHFTVTPTDSAGSLAYYLQQHSNLGHPSVSSDNNNEINNSLIRIANCITENRIFTRYNLKVPDYKDFKDVLLPSFKLVFLDHKI